ncbi:putative membrane protein (TIGR04086 family) [Geomicrobium halophilum]|uniref:Putative membrane protein (TIGR04086 family) n=1 Tax=Geomicrobium halophilum TaxID=549000 RepID=A0A841PL82_9BACL|nr:TIGR04086 family membrane protein [Geomicrobium halophilum]MBB6449509.1 putative membrane protein (TIGR04086 family) [Geomicrobium halophilum]
MESRLIKAFVISCITMLTLVLFSGLTLATILRFSSLSELSISGITIGTTVAITFIGGITAGLKSRSRGWLAGLLAGIAFAFIAAALQYLGYGVQVTLSQILVFIGSIFSASFGGMLGVSLFGSTR